MNKQTSSDIEYPFQEFQPVKWIPPGVSGKGADRAIFSIKRDHGAKGCFKLHNPNDEINDHRVFMEKVIIEYQIGGSTHNLFTVGDFFEVDYSFDEKGEGNIMGDIAERISRRITKYFLKHFSRHGKTGGIFDQRFNPAERNNFIVTHTDKYVLKIQNYPNLVLLKKTGFGKYGYENIKELDGLFDYRYKGKRHILVLESKLEKVNINGITLLNNLFLPLKQLFPDATFTYVLFTDKDSIYRKRNRQRLRKIKQHPLKIYHELKKYDIGVLYFTFNESRDDFEKMKNHLITQYRSVVRLDVQLYGKMVLSDRKIVLFDGGETPRIKLIKDHKHGMWREVKLRHKLKKV